MKKCPHCNNIIENDNAKYCGKCGWKQPEIIIDIQREEPERNERPEDGILLGIEEESDTPTKINHVGQSSFYDSSHKRHITKANSSSFNSSEEKNLLWAVKTGFKKYATFKGRASRSEYWYFFLFNRIICIFLFGFALVINQETVSLLLLSLFFLYVFATLLPELAVTIRRLHDIGKSGWLFCICFIPCIGPLILLYLVCQKSVDGNNLYG